jgi:hypothetical protein
MQQYMGMRVEGLELAEKEARCIHANLKDLHKRRVFPGIHAVPLTMQHFAGVTMHHAACLMSMKQMHDSHSESHLGNHHEAN